MNSSRLPFWRKEEGVQGVVIQFDEHDRKKNDWTLKDMADRQKVSAELVVHALPFK